MLKIRCVLIRSQNAMLHRNWQTFFFFPHNLHLNFLKTGQRMVKLKHKHVYRTVCCNDQMIYVSYLYPPFSVTFLPSLQLHKLHLTSTCFLSSGPFNPVMQHFLWGACKLTFNILMTKFLYVCQIADGSMNLCMFELFLSVNICADTVVTSKTKYLHSL